jgi:putative endonuclease
VAFSRRGYGLEESRPGRSPTAASDWGIAAQTYCVNVYYVYVVRCIDGSFYIGVTNDIERRFNEHCQGADPTCYTFERRPLKLVHVSEFAWIDQAIAFERKLKTWSHRKKRALVEGDFGSIKRNARGRDRKR